MSTVADSLPLLDEATELAIFLHDLESLDECPCQARHAENPSMAPCTAAVTHRYFSCTNTGKNICQAAASYVQESIDSIAFNYLCGECGHDCADCWRLVKI